MLNEYQHLSRRRFLEWSVKGLAAVGLGGLAGLAGQTVASGATSANGDGLLVRVARPYDAEAPVTTLETWLTPNDRFFVRSHFGPPPPERSSADVWRLRVGGLVDRTLTLTMEELRTLDEVSIVAVLQCSGNGRAFHRPKAPGVQWRKGAVGNARWTGVRLADVLRRAGVKADARHVSFLGADRPVSSQTPLFVRSIPIEKALHPDTLLAYDMNGESLPLLHGAPLRVITPGWMADACTKWLTDIMVLDQEAEGYFMETAYRHPIKPVQPGEQIRSADMEPVTTMPVKSLIVSPGDGDKLSPGDRLIEGVAWSGDERRVVRVEVSLDGGTTWGDARLKGEAQRYAWVQWSYAWKAERSGAHTIVSRATDDAGATQPLATPWNPGGFLWNGADRIAVSVEG